MDTTPIDDMPDEHPYTEALEAIAELDPAASPQPAEEFAATLARELEDVGRGAVPRQLAASFSAEEEGGS